MKKVLVMILLLPMLASCGSDEKKIPMQNSTSSGVITSPSQVQSQDDSSQSKEPKREEIPLEEKKQEKTNGEKTHVEVNYQTVKEKYKTLLAGATGETLWNQSSGKLAYIKKYQKNEVIMGEIHVLSSLTGEDAIIDSYTLRDAKAKDHEERHLTLKAFSPSGVYVWYEKSGFEACEGVMQETTTKEKLPYDLLGCPIIHWTSDAKQVVYAFGNGFYGEGQIIKSVRGNIRKTEAVTNNPEWKKKIASYLQNAGSVEPYMEKGEERVAFELVNDEGGVEKWSVDIKTGNDIKRK